MQARSIAFEKRWADTSKKSYKGKQKHNLPKS